MYEWKGEKKKEEETRMMIYKNIKRDKYV